MRRLRMTLGGNECRCLILLARAYTRAATPRTWGVGLAGPGAAAAVPLRCLCWRRGGGMRGEA